ncbi:MAG: cupin domain-containing protein [Kiritimatiellae bacterium]|nr:cupin domain-containing protein [Kiritimatiellia bacterium]
MKVRAADWIESLELNPHPEGGYYKEVYRSEMILSAEALPARFGAPRNCCTSIYYLLERGDFSAFHRMRQDEIWHFYDGGPARIHLLLEGGVYHSILLGRVPEQGYVLQGVVPGGCWFGAEPLEETDFVLVGCTVAPGFDFADFELARRAELTAAYPEQEALIHRLTR